MKLLLPEIVKKPDKRQVPFKRLLLVWCKICRKTLLSKKVSPFKKQQLTKCKKKPYHHPTAKKLPLPFATQSQSKNQRKMRLNHARQVKQCLS